MKLENVTNKHEKSNRVIYMDDELPFGKYKGRVLSEIWKEDPSYVTWLENNITYYEIKNEINTKWCEIFDKNDCAPRDGLYKMVCLDDMNTYYEIVKLKQGERFWDKYDKENEENEKNKRWWRAGCVAYSFVEDFSEQSSEWMKSIDYTNKKEGCWVICFSSDKDECLQYILTEDPLWEMECLGNVFIKGYHYTPHYTALMFMNHCDFSK